MAGGDNDLLIAPADGGAAAQDHFGRVFDGIQGQIHPRVSEVDSVWIEVSRVAATAREHRDKAAEERRRLKQL